MCNRLRKLTKLQQIITNIIEELRKIYNIAKEEKDKELKITLAEFIIRYNAINANFCAYVMKRIPESYRKDIIDKKFEDIIKDLKKNGK